MGPSNGLNSEHVLTRIFRNPAPVADDDDDDDYGDDDDELMMVMTMTMMMMMMTTVTRRSVRTCLLLPGLACKTPFWAPYTISFLLFARLLAPSIPLSSFFDPDF